MINKNMGAVRDYLIWRTNDAEKRAKKQNKIRFCCKA